MDPRGGVDYWSASIFLKIRTAPTDDRNPLKNSTLDIYFTNVIGKIALKVSFALELLVRVCFLIKRAPSSPLNMND